MSRIIKVNGEAIEVEPANGAWFTLEELQEAVGGYIELLVLPCGDFLYLDEEGKLKGKPLNKRATLLGRSAGIASTDYIVGDVIVVSPIHEREE